jgi:hypothetical protein
LRESGALRRTTGEDVRHPLHALRALSSVFTGMNLRDTPFDRAAEIS